MKEELLGFISNQDSVALNEYLEEHSPMDICEILREMDDVDLSIFFSLLNDYNLAKIIENAEEDQRFLFCKYLDNKTILGGLSIGRRKELINAMKSDEQHHILT